MRCCYCPPPSSSPFARTNTWNYKTDCYICVLCTAKDVTALYICVDFVWSLLSTPSPNLPASLFLTSLHWSHFLYIQALRPFVIYLLWTQQVQISSWLLLLPPLSTIPLRKTSFSIYFCISLSHFWIYSTFAWSVLLPPPLLSPSLILCAFWM